ncbi:MAG TPA: adenosine deaminase [Solirubrobacteraceae bacterium]|nr:adenosine deaminase [Solirubrobacteraceae bacterium]
MLEQIRALPKAELHLHIEGTLEPELAFALARRNGIELRFASVEALARAYNFADLQSFLNLYYECMAVLLRPADFADLANAYLERATRDGVRHVEMFFDPQAHTSRGVPLDDVVAGLRSAVLEAPVRHGISASVIACFLRDRPVSEAMATLDGLAGHLDVIQAVGLDSAEVGNPPSAFREVFAAAEQLGLRKVAHAGEEGPPEYVWEALDVLGVERIDHGIRAVEDRALLRRLAADRVPLTVCPLSNVRLRCVESLEEHPLPRLLEAGVLVTINSDDPAYFGGYVAENYHALQQALGLDMATLETMARNSLAASFPASG